MQVNEDNEKLGLAEKNFVEKNRKNVCTKLHRAVLALLVNRILSRGRFSWNITLRIINSFYYDSEGRIW